MKKTFYIVIIIAVLWAVFVEPKLLVINRYKIENAGLKGLKIVLVGDFHSKPNQEKFLKKVVKKVNEQKPDLILSTGDFVNGQEDSVTLPAEKIADNLGMMKSKYGFYTVLGNHDYRADTSGIIKALKKNNIKVLENDSTVIHLGAKKLYIAGVKDPYSQKPDLDAALENTENPVILLTHSPDIFPKVPDTAELTLAGHTHGGQVRIPLFEDIFVPSKYRGRYAKGLIEEKGKTMIVTKGIGTSTFPVRFNCLPEIVVIEF